MNVSLRKNDILNCFRSLLYVILNSHNYSAHLYLKFRLSFHVFYSFRPWVIKFHHKISLIYQFILNSNLQGTKIRTSTFLLFLLFSIFDISYCLSVFSSLDLTSLIPLTTYWRFSISLEFLLFHIFSKMLFTK